MFSLQYLLKGIPTIENVLLGGSNSTNIDTGWLYLRWRLSERLSCLTLLLQIDMIPVIVTKSNTIVNNTLF